MTEKRPGFVVALGLAWLSVVVPGCHLERADTTLPKQVDSHRDLKRMGDVAAGAGELVRAEQYYAAALDAGARVDEVLPLLLAACIDGRRYDAAANHAERYLEGSSRGQSAQLLLAGLYIASGRVPRAVGLLRHVIDTRPKQALAHYLLGHLYRFEMQDYERAHRHYVAYLQLEPRGPHAREARQGRLRVPARFAAGARPRTRSRARARLRARARARSRSRQETSP